MLEVSSMAAREGHVALLEQQFRQLAVASATEFAEDNPLHLFLAGSISADVFVATLAVIETPSTMPMIDAIRDMAYNLEGRPVGTAVRAFQYLHGAVDRVPVVATYNLGAFFGARLPTVVDLRSVQPNFRPSVFEDTTGLQELLLNECVARLPPRFCSKSKQLVRVVAPGTQIVAESAFEGCGRLQTADLGVVYGVDDRAFYGCFVLDLDPACLGSCVYIGGSAFEDSGIRAVDAMDALVYVGAQAFKGALHLEELHGAATDVAAEMCAGCVSLTAARWPEATKIGRAAFEGCLALGEVELRDHVQIDGRAFGRTGLVTVDVRNADFVGTGQFEGCRALVELRVGAGVASVPKQLCRGCVRLARVLQSGPWRRRQRVLLPSGHVASVMATAGDEAVVLVDGRTVTTAVAVADCTALPSFGVIGCEAFSWCRQLVVMDLWPTRAVRSRAFYRAGLVTFQTGAQLDVCCCSGAEQLQAVLLPKQERVPAHAFLNCTALRSLASVATDFGPYAFHGCCQLRLVLLRPDKAVFVGAWAFTYARLGKVVLGPGSHVGTYGLAEMGAGPDAELSVGRDSKLASHAAYASGVRRLWLGPDVLVGRHAFQRCRQLRSVALNSSVVRPAAFSGCSRLALVVLPRPVRLLSRFAPAACRQTKRGQHEILPAFAGRVVQVTTGAAPALFAALFTRAERQRLWPFLLALHRWARAGPPCRCLPHELVAGIVLTVYYVRGV